MVDGMQHTNALFVTNIGTAKFTMFKVVILQNVKVALAELVQQLMEGDLIKSIQLG